MGKVPAFVALELRILKPYFKSYAVILLMAVAFGFVFKSNGILIAILGAGLMLVTSYPFAIMENNDLDYLYHTLSVNRKTIVAGRYLSLLVIALTLDIAMVFLVVLFDALIGSEMPLQENILSICILSAIFFLVAAYQYPIYFKFGYNKSRMIAMGPLFLVFFLLPQLPALLAYFNIDLSLDLFYTSALANPVMLCALPLLIGLLALLLSGCISYRLYRNMDL